MTKKKKQSNAKTCCSAIIKSEISENSPQIDSGKRDLVNSLLCNPSAAKMVSSSLPALALFALCAMAPSVSAADTGNWTVGNCILAQFAMEVTLHPNHTHPNVTQVVVVPADAKADASQSSCGADEQQLNLDWVERSDNGTELARNVTIVFARRNDTRP